MIVFLRLALLQKQLDHYPHFSLASGLSEVTVRAGPKYIYKNFQKTPINVLCIPLGELIQALGWTRIHFLSLDIEGSDYDVLSTFPWSSIHVEASYDFVILVTY
jgi:hypothetical protein